MNLRLIYISFLISIFSCKGQTKSEVKNEFVSKTKSEYVKIVIKIKSPPKNIKLQLYEPISNFCNFEYCPPSNSFSFRNDTTLVISRKTFEPNTFIIQYGVCRAILNLFPKDSVVVAITFNNNGYDLNFMGSDSLFHKKYNQDAYKIFMDKGFETIITKTPETASVMISKIKNYIALKTAFIDTLKNTSALNDEKYNYYKKIYSYSIAAISANPISMYYTSKDNSNFDWFNQLYKSYPPFDSVVSKCLYGQGYLTKYLYDIENKRTSFYNGTYDTSWKAFGSYSTYGYATPHLQKFLWGKMLIILAQHNSNEINIKKAFQLFNTKFVSNDYSSIIENLVSKKIDVFSGKIINSKPITISELWNNNFKGKPLFVDLWATWCAPCTDEFQYNKKLETFLNSKNIQMLFLSMDKISDKAKWEKAVKNYSLNGDNIIVNELLQKDILNNIYGSNNWSIPRYFLINKNGEIVSKETLHPSDEQDLYTQIETLLK